MGLDMYLYKTTYVKNWNHQEEDEKHNIVIKKGGKVREDINPERISNIVEEVGYWRKFNALHKWIIDNIAEGEDNCQEIYLSKEDIKKIISTLKEVKESLDNSLVEGEPKDISIAEKLLPPSDGFFFGSQDIDDWYHAEVGISIIIFEEALLGKSDSTITYRASW